MRSAIALPNSAFIPVSFANSAAWSSFLEQNERGASCLGPVSGQEAQRERYQATAAALSRDPVEVGMTAIISAALVFLVFITHRLRFTREVFALDNCALVDAIAAGFSSDIDDPIAGPFGFGEKNSLAFREKAHGHGIDQDIAVICRVKFDLAGTGIVLAGDGHLLTNRGTVTAPGPAALRSGWRLGSATAISGLNS